MRVFYLNNFYSSITKLARLMFQQHGIQRRVLSNSPQRVAECLSQLLHFATSPGAPQHVQLSSLHLLVQLLSQQLQL
uniref:Uncharacterized protein n=1 Tax=Timema tahoe TaxID=61484 RepID=A0A7R9FKJ3_9NEOP|nr:unnamed protein product [Timema tahoe]